MLKFMDEQDVLTALRGASITVEKVRNHIVRFLNRWHCRFPKDGARRLWEGLGKAADKLDKLPSDLTLQNFGLHNLPPLMEAFSCLVDVDRVSGTAASKILHLMRPRCFVMWDGRIAERYGFSISSPTGYARYMLLMKDVAVALQKDTRLSQVARHLATEGRDRPVPVAKLLDEWNWVAITKREQDRSRRRR